MIMPNWKPSAILNFLPTNPIFELSVGKQKLVRHKNLSKILNVPEHSVA
jgi:hypothetical protein